MAEKVWALKKKLLLYFEAIMSTQLRDLALYIKSGYNKRIPKQCIHDIMIMSYIYIRYSVFKVK